MRLSDVITRFTLISRLEPDKVSVWTALCIDAMQQINRMVLNGVEQDEETCIRLANCAAALAFYKFSFYAQDADVRSFTAGSVNVTVDSTLTERAKAVWEQELSAASDILRVSDDFSFRGVRV